MIGCGRNTAAGTGIRRASGGRTRRRSRTRVGRGEFDMLFVPEHDRLRGPRIVVTGGALNRVTAQLLAAERRRFPALEALPRPILGVLIGGSNRAYRLDLARLGEIAGMVAALVRQNGGSAVVTPSRRTGALGLSVLREQLRGVPGAIWDGTGDNPYYAYLAIADALLVTADSVSMVSEAAATGKPVHHRLPGRRARPVSRDDARPASPGRLPAGSRTGPTRRPTTPRGRRRLRELVSRLATRQP